MGSGPCTGRITRRRPRPSRDTRWPASGDRKIDAADRERNWFRWAVLMALGLACFARLIADPSGLIVDGERPSIDFANHGDPRPLGNDATFVFLPHHLYVAKVLARVWPLARLGRHGFRRPAAHREPARRCLLSSGLDRWFCILARDTGLADGRAPALGRPWALSCWREAKD